MGVQWTYNWRHQRSVLAALELMTVGALEVAGAAPVVALWGETEVINSQALEIQLFMYETDVNSWVVVPGPSRNQSAGGGGRESGPRGGGGARRGRGGAGAGAGRGKKPTPTAEQLDAELDAYVKEINWNLHFTKKIQW